MSLEHQLPVLMKKTQMSSDRAQCGLTSLLPMSCRGRAEAFARRLHTRLRNLGSAGGDAGENRWLGSREVNGPVRGDSDLFFDFELECESPSSPVDEYDAAFTDRSPSDESDVPFYDVDSEPDSSLRSNTVINNKKLPETHTSKTSPPRSNGFKFSSAFYLDNSPIKSQPSPRENGHSDARLFSPITFDDCARAEMITMNGGDETDSALKLSLQEHPRIPVLNSSVDSDSEFESAKSETFDIADEAVEAVEDTRLIRTDDNLVSDHLVVSSENKENIETCATEEATTTNHSLNQNVEVNINTIPLEVVTVAVPADKDPSPAPEEDKTLLTVDAAQLSNEAEQETEADADERPQRVRRCSSLKTGKTPPGTPGRKKIVRFADVLGLDLADVKTFMDEIPVIPKSAYEDLANADLSASSPPARPPVRFGALSLVPLFQPPRDLTDALEARCVCLESARVAEGTHITVCGSVRVRNLDFHKTVHIRYSMDGWKTYTDLKATYVPGSCDGFSDRFQFLLYAPSISAGQRLEFAIRFQCKGRQYWDSNFGVNYCYECLPLGAPPPNMAANTPAPPLHPTRDFHASFY